MLPRVDTATFGAGDTVGDGTFDECQDAVLSCHMQPTTFAGGAVVDLAADHLYTRTSAHHHRATTPLRAFRASNFGVRDGPTSQYQSRYFQRAACTDSKYAGRTSTFQRSTSAPHQRD
eukprot:4446654-Prymnesium_polylepis.1